MSRVIPFHFVLSKVDLPVLPDWQDAIDRMNLLFRPILLTAEPGPGGGRVRIGDRAISFDVERRPIETVLRAVDRPRTVRWSFATGFRGDGTQDSSAMSIVAASSLAQFGDGVRYDEQDGIMPEGPDLVHIVDATLAVSLSEMERYYARYPDERPGRHRSSEPAVIASRISPH